MLMQHTAHFNDLTDEMRNEIEARVKSFGKMVRYRFNIENDNPDPEKYGGVKKIFPAAYTLDPCVFDITDQNEKRPGKSRGKKIGLIDAVDKDNKPERFFKIRVYARDKGILELHLDNDEHFQKAVYLELHPKQKDGKFSNPRMRQVFSRIDDAVYATQQRNERSARLKALNAVSSMSEKEIVDFADAMSWDSTVEMPVLINQIEQLAEDSPDFFNDIVSGKRVEFQAAIKKALDRKIIAFDPAEYKFTWSSNKQPVVILQPSIDKNEVEVMSEWLQGGGTKADEVYKKIKALLEPAK